MTHDSSSVGSHDALAVGSHAMQAQGCKVQVHGTWMGATGLRAQSWVLWVQQGCKYMCTTGL